MKVFQKVGRKMVFLIGSKILHIRCIFSLFLVSDFFSPVQEMVSINTINTLILYY